VWCSASVVLCAAWCVQVSLSLQAELAVSTQPEHVSTHAHSLRDIAESVCICERESQWCVSPGRRAGRDRLSIMVFLRCD
jgi:hypothetical protein